MNNHGLIQLSSLITKNHPKNDTEMIGKILTLQISTKSGYLFEENQYPSKYFNAFLIFFYSIQLREKS